MYSSYEQTDLWTTLENKPKGLGVSFVRAEHSAFRWTEDTLARLEGLGAEVELLEDSSHWVHTDNPEGLLRMMEGDFRTLPTARFGR